MHNLPRVALRFRVSRIVGHVSTSLFFAPPGRRPQQGRWMEHQCCGEPFVFAMLSILIDSRCKYGDKRVRSFCTKELLFHWKDKQPILLINRIVCFLCNNFSNSSNVCKTSTIVKISFLIRKEKSIYIINLYLQHIHKSWILEIILYSFLPILWNILRVSVSSKRSLFAVTWI